MFAIADTLAVRYRRSGRSLNSDSIVSYHSLVLSIDDCYAALFHI